jgi:hypothetical protein
MAVLEKEIRDLVFLENKGQNDGPAFEQSAMGLEFSILVGRAREINYWYKSHNYLVFENISLRFSHTVAKVFEANNPRHVAYVVLNDVDEEAMPKALYYFILNARGESVCIQLHSHKDYVFHLEDKKYNLAADGAVTEAKKEEQIKKEPVVDFQNGVVKIEQDKKEAAEDFKKSPDKKKLIEALAEQSQNSENKSKQGKGFFEHKFSLLLSSSSSPDIKRVRFSKGGSSLGNS